MATNKATKKNTKATFAQIMDSLVVLCRAEKGGQLLCSFLNDAFGEYDNAATYLSQVVARCDNPVIVMLAKQAMVAR